MIGFVDDSTGQVNDFLSNTQPDPETLAQIMKIDAQLWSDLLWISGGSLELPKCSYHQVHFDFLPTGRPIMRPGQVTNQIYLSDAQTGAPIPIQSKSVLNPHKTLGHYRAPAGLAKTQLKELRNKSKTMARQVSSSPLDRRESRTFYDVIYLKSMGFVLPNCYFTEKELNSVQSPAICAFIPKCGFNRNTKRAIIFGPKKLAGAGFGSLFHLQGEGQILQFLKYWRTDSQTSKLLRVSVSWSQYQAGTSKSILHDVISPLPHLEARWLPSLRLTLGRIQATIELDINHVTPLQRVHDEHIMD
jgi:hypothetical protein